MSLRRSFTITLLLAASLAGQKKSGIDLDGIDPECKPCQDFWRYANGRWLDRNPIPATKSRWGTLSVVGEANQERLRTILDAAAAESATRTANEKRIGDLYSACMDLPRLETLGMKPLASELARIDRIASIEDLARELVRDQKDAPVGPAVLIARQDMKNSAETVAWLFPTGISLPERDYYFKDDARTKKIREEFLGYAARLLTLAGAPAAEAPAAAARILAFETRFAQPMLTNVARRDPYSTYHPIGLAGLAELSPTIDWKAALASLGVPAGTPVVVAEPEHTKVLERELHASPLEDWKLWLRWKILSGAAPFLSKAFVDEDFRYRSGVLRGVTQPEPRWKTCVTVVDDSLGDALGEAFVRKYFPPTAKARMNDLIENLRATLREQISNSDWMDAATKKSAVEKLNAFRSKIGYPERWRDYSAVHVARQDLWGSVNSADEVNRLYQLSKIGKPLDRNDWGMTPPTVNAYYSPLRNEIAFPAGILQPPLFDLEADDAANYGAIGAVIGHEMGHGFDDQGSKYAATGDLRNWWTPEDRQKFDARAACVVNQFNTLDVGDGLRHNGRLVVGEALGDLGGLTLAYRAYHRALGGKEAPVIDGYTGDQRFFLAFARVWSTQLRPETLRLLLNTDPHPVARFRAIGTLQNMPEFQRAFQCKAGDPMVRPESERCRLW